MDRTAKRQRRRKRRHCPRPGCDATMQANRFCCWADWVALSEETRQKVWNSAGMGGNDRVEALAAARREWEEADGQGDGRAAG